MVNWRTTLFAAVTALGVIFTQLGYGFDDNPDTVTNWDIIMKTLGLFLTATGLVSWGAFTRDSKVSDEQAGAGRVDH